MSGTKDGLLNSEELSRLIPDFSDSVPGPSALDGLLEGCLVAGDGVIYRLGQRVHVLKLYLLLFIRKISFGVLKNI
jgi:hypothetical protein